ncbi:ADOP family duplicated permease [Pelagicoccus sp. SDUM812003]|uniref:ADOP family duplicated permease n=1 Tax=Pelagicoccus sp. SDUM812003 TaxID=3041267 RepID=UPI00280C99C6|nr:ADOP family duplicated permease [Pelagicoccus sp. SDUM812003]MDQ8202231.1 ADOP family duplicated permease [Pelagicoccus sp. SDUM812003]
MRPFLRLRQRLAEIRNILLGTLRLRWKEQALDEEIQFHLEERAEELVKNGHSAKQARTLARKEFGNVDRCREECRDSWGNRVVTNSIQDLKFSVRSLARSKGYCLTIISTVALCIAAHTIAFASLYNLLFEPPPFRDPDRLVEVYNTLPQIGQPKSKVSIHQYKAFQAEADLFDELALWYFWTFNIGEDSSATRGIGSQVTANYFDLLDIEPLLGNFFTEEDREQGREDLIVLTQTCWENRYGADPDIIGKQIQLSGAPFTIVAVAPRKLEAMNADTIMLRPYTWTEAEASQEQHYRFRPTLYGRLKAGVSFEQAAAQLNTIENNFVENAPNREPLTARKEEAGHELALGAVRAEQTRGARNSLFLLQTAALLIVALGCANISNLTLNRFNTRLNELSIRISLGANRAAIFRQLLIEGFLLALVGAAVGIGIAALCFSYLNAAFGDLVREAQPVAIDGAVALSILLIAALIALVSNIAPLSQLLRFRLGASAQSNTRLASSSAKSRVFSNTLVVIQFSLAIVVLVGASLLLRSFHKTMEVDPGFDTERVVYFRTARNITQTDVENWATIESRILEALRAIPGVESVSYSSTQPANPRINVGQWPLRGRPYPGADQAPRAYAMGVSPSYFETMGIPILAGRSFEETDYQGNPFQYYLVDERFAKRYIEDGNAVGQAFAFGGNDDDPESWRTIIGVAKSVNLAGLDNSEHLPTVYYLQPKQQPGLSVEIRTRLSPAACLSLAREALSDVDSSLPMYHQATIQELFDEGLKARRVLTAAVSILAAIGLLLAAIGVYGMLSYDVTQRVREIGIRGSIGASSRQIVALFVRQGITKALIGIAVGVIIAVSLVRFTRSFLFEIEPYDPLSFAAAFILIFGVAFLASWIPARRAARLPPTEALRAE